MNVAFTGLIVGLGAAMSFGPMALLCVRRTLAYGRQAGVLTGAGIALGDATYALVAVLGLTVVADMLIRLEFALSILGATFLCIIGVRGVFNAGPAPSSNAVLKAPRGSLISAYGLTLTNPMTIVFFAAVFAGVSLGGGYLAGLVFVACVFAASMFWWFILILIISGIGAIFRPKTIVWLNRASGILIAALAIGILLRQVA